MIILIDNYDSFTFNLYQAFSEFGYEIEVLRNDKTSLEQIQALNPSHIIIGPGPKAPKDAGISLDVIRHFKGVYPILGICLGHQAILHAFGVEIVHAKNIVHGKIEPLIHNAKGIFRSISPRTPIVRYHSLVGKKEQVPSCFIVSAESEDGEVMAIEHKDYKLVGLQFHPESIGTLEGKKMIANFLQEKEPICLQPLLLKALNQQDLSLQESMLVMGELTQGNMNDAQIASLLTSLQIKGVCAHELAGFAKVLKQKATPLELDIKTPICLDIVGTGGSAKKTFNVSTTASLLLASLAKERNFSIIKHGNKAITSQSGSADLLFELGICANMPLANIKACYQALHLTFLFAQTFHSALRHAINARKSLGFKSAFNLIGPLSNPMPVTHQLIGVFDKSYTCILAQALNLLGIRHAMVVSGLDGYDEVSLCAPTQVSELHEGRIETYEFHPHSIGLDLVCHEELKGGGARENAQISLDIFEAKPSAKLNLVALNMAFALYLCQQAKSIKEGFILAQEIIASKKVLALLDDFRNLSHASNHP